MLQWLRKIDALFGFHNDEWAQHIHMIARRNAYIVTCVLALLIGAYQSAQTQRQEVQWITLALVCVSLLILFVRRVQLGKLTETDERIKMLMHKAILWAYLFLIFTLFIYASYGFWVLNDGFSMIFWSVCFLAGPTVILFTRTVRNTADGNMGYWLTITIPTLIMTVFPLSLIVWDVVNSLLRGGPLPDIDSTLLILAFFAPMIGINIVFVLGTWRSWQNMREERRGQ